MKLQLAIAALGVLAVGCASRTTVNSNAQSDSRMEWFRDARFGMFIHWGLYAVPAGTWGSETHHGEWIMNTAHIPVETYEKFKDQFNPVKFDADAWVKMAKDAGMKYIVITSKHHDGFCLWDSKFTDYDVMSTPFKRDILKELSVACKKANIKLCFYHSIMDWHHPDYLPRREWEKRPATGANFSRYVTHLRNQVQELLTTYPETGILWFDGEWEGTWTHELGESLYKLCLESAPRVIVNNRVDKGRGGMAGMSDAGFAGDYGTPEQEIPARGLPGVDWETCMTMNNNWGYNSHDKNFKTTQDLIQKLSDIASKGGNFLLNIGPMSSGEFPPESVERLGQIGAWMRVNGEAIYGTTASPFENLAFGRCTQKRSGANTLLYLHIFQWPAGGKLQISGLGNMVKSATLLADAARKIETRQSDGVLEISNLPAAAPDPNCSVLKIEVAGDPIIYEPPVIHADATDFVDDIPVRLATRSTGLDIYYTTDGSEPAPASQKYEKSLIINATCVVKARAFHGGKAVSGTVEQKFTKVTPWPVSDKRAQKPGLRYQCYDGKFDRLPDFARVKPLPSINITDTVGLPKETRRDHVAVRFWGAIEAPKTQMYTFALTSDDGSRLFIDGREIINNDGPHGAETKRGVAPLAAGTHAIEVQWFNRDGGVDLGLQWASLGGALTPVPASALKHDE